MNNYEVSYMNEEGSTYYLFVKSDLSAQEVEEQLPLRVPEVCEISAVNKVAEFDAIVTPITFP